jgi:ketosteroid isomerase-like protein
MKTTTTSRSNWPKDQVTEVLNTMIVAQETGNWDQFSQCFDQGEDTINVGSDLDEFWVGWDTFKRNSQKLFATRKGNQINVTNTHINISENGDVAWYAQMIDTTFETKAEPIRIEGFRHTGVMVNKNGQWKVVQSHISAPVLDDATFTPNSDLDMFMQI